MALKLNLRKVPLFKFLTVEQAQKLANTAKIIEKSSGEAVLSSGQDVPGIYIVAEGDVGVFVPGSLTPIATIDAGGSFGEMAVLEGDKASASINVGDGGATLVLLKGETVQGEIEADPDLGLRVYRAFAMTLSDKLRATNARISAEFENNASLIKSLGDGDTSEVAAAAGGETTKVLESLQKMVQGQTEKLNIEMDDCVVMVTSVSAKLGGRSQTLMKLADKLEATAEDYKTHSVSLVEKLGTMTKFIGNTQKFLAESSGV